MWKVMEETNLLFPIGEKFVKKRKATGEKKNSFLAS